MLGRKPQEIVYRGHALIPCLSNQQVKHRLKRKKSQRNVYVGALPQSASEHGAALSLSHRSSPIRDPREATSASLVFYPGSPRTPDSLVFLDPCIPFFPRGLVVLVCVLCVCVLQCLSLKPGTGGNPTSSPVTRGVKRGGLGQPFGSPVLQAATPNCSQRFRATSSNPHRKCSIISLNTGAGLKLRLVSHTPCQSDDCLDLPLPRTSRSHAYP